MIYYSYHITLPCTKYCNITLRTLSMIHRLIANRTRISVPTSNRSSEPLIISTGVQILRSSRIHLNRALDGLRKGHNGRSSLPHLPLPTTRVRQIHHPNTFKTSYFLLSASQPAPKYHIFHLRPRLQGHSPPYLSPSNLGFTSFMVRPGGGIIHSLRNPPPLGGPPKTPDTQLSCAK